MNNPKRREEKKRRREKRLARRERPDNTLETVLRTFEQLAGIEDPTTWPGAAHPSLDRPDRIKYEMSVLTKSGIGRDLCRQLEVRLKKGLLDFLPNLDHWGMEEFFWHGLPGNPWNPVDKYLENQGDRFPEAARVQLARWKEARIGCYEVGPVIDDLVYLREVDIFTSRRISPWVRAIALNIRGVNIYSDKRGQINTTYLAPWSPEKGIFCSMGYGYFSPLDNISFSSALVCGMRSIEAVTFPFPWLAGKSASRECLQQWRSRDWHQFMRTQVRCPFQAALLTDKGPLLGIVSSLITRSFEEFQQRGLYFAANRQKAVCGATAIIPLDFESPNAMAFAEYREYRRLVGPPPVTPGLEQEGTSPR